MASNNDLRESSGCMGETSAKISLARKRETTLYSPAVLNPQWQIMATPMHAQRESCELYIICCIAFVLWYLYCVVCQNKQTKVKSQQIRAF